ncbi:hypothetical protein LTR86_010900 [Recurvomyces mirabilis]|nr:hypothetical protein LTR86_010900 [Recurvomyces mirabilis]
MMENTTNANTTRQAEVADSTKPDRDPPSETDDSSGPVNNLQASEERQHEEKHARQVSNEHGNEDVGHTQLPLQNEKEVNVTAGVSTDDGKTPAADDDGDEFKYPSGTKLALLTLGLCLATFVVALDNTIIATAIPRITTVFDSLNDVGWYGSSYLLTTTSLQPSFGKVYTYFNVKWTYLTALCIFELGSIICAAATSSKMLIVGRAVAGAGAAALFSGGMNIVGYCVPLRKRAMYIASLSSMFGIASVVGPILGGALTDKASWRWCFWINLPFGGVALATVFLLFSEPARQHTNMSVREKIKQIDLLGAFFLICAIVCLLLALQWGGSLYPWQDSRVWGCLLGFGLILAVFLGLQFWLQERATIPPRIFKNRTVAACAAFSAFLAMALYSHIYYLPFYFQAVKGTSAEGSVGGAITFLGPYNPPMWAGVIIFTIGSAMIYTLKVGSGTGVWIGYQILAGVGAGACVQIPFIAVQVVLNEKDMPVGNAVAIFFNTLGGAISVSIAQNIFSNTLIKQLPKDAPGVDPAMIIGAGATHIREVTTPQQLPGVLLAYDKAITTAFILPIATSGLAFLASLAMEWKSVKGKKLIPGGA